MGRILQLYQLQLLDSEMDKTSQELAQVTSKLGESEALKAARTAVTSAEQAARQAQTTLQDLDLEVKSLVTKIEGQEKKLYSGTVLSAKEAANLQDEVTSLKRWQSQREENLLEAMLNAEEVEKTLRQTQAKLAQLQADWETGQKDLITAKENLEHNLAEVQQRRPSITNHISRDDLKHYEDLRVKKAGRAVAAVQGGVCQGCGISPSNSKIQRARTGTELAYCGACGRILYVP